MPISPDPRAAAAVRSAHSRALTADKAARADRHRAAIRNFAAEHGITIGELARRMKLKNANAFYNFLHGRSSELSVATLLRVCDAFPGTTLDQLVGRKRPESEIPAPAITEATISITAPEPAPPDGTRLLETGPMVSVALEDLSRSLQALRMTVDLVERDLARVAAALDPSVRRSSPA